LKTKKNFIVTGLSLGDEGKGGIVDYLARRYDALTVIRYNGGGQAAHNVVTPDGTHHTFAQFTSGTFVPGVRTFLSRFMVIEPIAMLQESDTLRSVGVHDALERMIIDEECVVVTPFHWTTNRLRELARGNNRHGSCGKGVGEATYDSQELPDSLVVRARDLRNPGVVSKKLRQIQEYKVEQVRTLGADFSTNEFATQELKTLHSTETTKKAITWYKDLVRHAKIVPSHFLTSLLQENGTTICEGAQGVLLDEWHGFHPYTTRSTTTPANALTLLEENQYDGDVCTIGVIRAYATRHGVGPFVTESDALRSLLPDNHNGFNEWQREFRAGWLDFVALRYALRVAKRVDCLAVTNVDRLTEFPDWNYCTEYRYNGTEAPQDLFRTADGLIQTIRYKDAPDLVHQGRLTEEMANCTPVYKKCECDNKELLRIIEEETATQVGIISSGQTAEEKETTSFLRSKIKA
jgi:adenylosuccinate synthase